MTAEEAMSQTPEQPGHEPIDGRCNAPKRSGGLCKRPAGDQTDHPGIGRCKFHLGNTKTHRAAAVTVQAQRDVILFGARRDIHPAEALLELVQWTAGEVDYWRQRVRELDESDLTWGITRVKDDGDDRGTTEEARPNIAYSMLRDASDRLEKYSTAALRAGVSERLVQVAEQQGAQFLAVLIRSLTRLGIDVSPGSEAARVVLEELRPLRLPAQLVELEEGDRGE